MRYDLTKFVVKFRQFRQDVRQVRATKMGASIEAVRLWWSANPSAILDARWGMTASTGADVQSAGLPLNILPAKQLS